MKVLDKFIDVLGKPINFNVLMASFLTSLFLLATNFLSANYLNRLHLEEFLDKYNYIVIIVFFVSFFLLVIHFTARYSKKKQDAALKKIYSEQQEKLFQDAQAMEILESLYAQNSQPGWLPIYNQKVKLLEQYGLIIKASNQAVIYDISNPSFPYILQPFAEDRLKKCIQIVECIFLIWHRFFLFGLRFAYLLKKVGQQNVKQVSANCTIKN